MLQHSTQNTMVRSNKQTEVHMLLNCACDIEANIDGGA